MNQPSSPETAVELAQRLADEITRRRQTDQPMYVAIDGRSGSGKSTVAAALVDVMTARHGLTVTVIEGDQFYAGGTAEQWDHRTASEKADLVIDWRRQATVLQSLRETGEAEWRSFDWEAPDWNSTPPPLSALASPCAATDIVILEGAYSTRPELHDLLDVLVLLDTPADQRRAQLLQREGDEYRSDWEGRWSAAEDHYFGQVMTTDRFDIVL